MRASKFGSGLRDLLDTNFFLQVGHSLLPLRRAVMMQSWQNLWRHSFVVIVVFSMSKQMGHISSLCKLRGDTAISVLSLIASWGVLWSSYKLSSHVLLGGGISDDILQRNVMKTRWNDTNCARYSERTILSRYLRNPEWVRILVERCEVSQWK